MSMTKENNMRLTRTRKIVARASDAEYLALHAIARRQGRKVSEALRELIRDRAMQLGVWPEETMGGAPTWQSEEI